MMRLAEFREAGHSSGSSAAVVPCVEEHDIGTNHDNTEGRAESAVRCAWRRERSAAVRERERELREARGAAPCKPRPAGGPMCV